MRNVLFIVALFGFIFIAAQNTLAVTIHEPGQINWYSTMDEVKTREMGKELVYSTENVLIYQTELLGLSAFITHYFNHEQRLVMSLVEFPHNLQEQNLFIDYFYALKNWVIEIYGKPQTFIDFEWRNGCITDAEEQVHFIMLGKLSYAQNWLTEKTAIRLILDKVEEQLVLRLTLAEREYWDVPDNQKVSTHPWIKNRFSTQ